MKILSPKILRFSLLSLFLFAGISLTHLSAQQAQLFIELQLNSSLVNSQAINLTNIFSGQAEGTNFYSFYLENEASRQANNLYFRTRLESQRRGIIFERFQEQGRPFSLRGGQKVYSPAPIQDRIPGVEEEIIMDAELTPSGEEFLNKLGGSTRLPPDRYTFRIEIRQDANNGSLVAFAEQEFGGDILEDQRDIYLTSPGDVVGSTVEITNPYPEFRWEGVQNSDYRLIVVEAKGQDSPESLMQGARSSAPAIQNGTSGAGTLLDYEILDVRLRETSFQMPPSGVQSLQPGKRYFWQIFTELRTSNGVEATSSEIWNFSLAATGNRLTSEGQEEANRILKSLVQTGIIEQLLENTFRLRSIVVDGEVYSGTAALQKLVELKERADNEEITIVNN